jgi:hypothetical protein
MVFRFDGALGLDALSRDPRFAGAGLNPKKVTRWIKRGLRGIRLKALAVGRDFYVRPEDLVAFCEQVAEAKIAKPSVVQAGKQDADKLRSALRERGLI